MESQLFKPGCDRATLLQEANAALDHIATAIADTIIVNRSPCSASATLALGRDDRFYPVAPQPAPDPARLIGPITTQPPRAEARAAAPTADAHTIEHGFELGRLMRLAGQDTDTERQTSAITQDMQFGAKAAA